MLHRLLLVGSIIAGLVGCGAGDQESAVAPDVVAQIDTERLSVIVKALASDEFEGRTPVTEVDTTESE